MKLIIERSLDVRVTVIRLIERLSTTSNSISPCIVQSLHPLFAKETNDSAISALIDALMAHLGVVLKNNTSVDDKITKLVLSGLTDKRSKIKATWAVATSAIIWETSQVNSASISFSKVVAKSLFVVFNEIASNAVQAFQNGTIAAGYAISASTLGTWLGSQDTQLRNFVKDSF